MLQTERLLLRLPGADCTALYERFYTDAEASRFYGGPKSPAEAWARLAFDRGVWELQGFGVWVLERRADAALLGVCGFWQGRGWPRELTWWLLPEARGLGLALEASRAAIAHAREVWAWPEVETYCADDNLAARGLIERLGGVKVRRQNFPDGQTRDVFLLSV